MMHTYSKHAFRLLAIAVILSVLVGFGVAPAQAQTSSELWICESDGNESYPTRTFYTPWGTVSMPDGGSNCTVFNDLVVLNGVYNFTLKKVTGSPLQSIICYNTDYSSNTSKTYNVSTGTLTLQVSAFPVYDFCMWSTQ